jgi:hypothetical protein
LYAFGAQRIQTTKTSKISDEATEVRSVRLWEEFSTSLTPSPSRRGHLSAGRKTVPHLKWIAIMTEMTRSHRKWNGETCFYIPRDATEIPAKSTWAIYFAAEPPALLTAMRRTLTGAGVDSDDIRTEEFAITGHPLLRSARPTNS